jgi:hypothetical protein
MKYQWITQPPVTLLTRDAMLTGNLRPDDPPPPPAITIASNANGNSGLVPYPPDKESQPLTNTSKHTNNTNPQQSKAADKRSSVSNLIDLNKVKNFIATYEQNDCHTGMMQQYKEAKEKLELEDYLEKCNDEKVMCDILLYKECKQLVEDSTNEEFIQQQFPYMVNFFLKKSTPIVAPKNSTNTPPVNTPVVGETQTTPWIPGLLRKLNDPNYMNIHHKNPNHVNIIRTHTELCGDSFTDEDEDEECKEFASDGLVADK